MQISMTLERIEPPAGTVRRLSDPRVPFEFSGVQAADDLACTAGGDGPIGALAEVITKGYDGVGSINWPSQAGSRQGQTAEDEVP